MNQLLGTDLVGEEVLSLWKQKPKGKIRAVFVFITTVWFLLELPDGRLSSVKADSVKLR